MASGVALAPREAHTSAAFPRDAHATPLAASVHTSFGFHSIRRRHLWASEVSYYWTAAKYGIIDSWLGRLPRASEDYLILYQRRSTCCEPTFGVGVRLP